MNSFAFFARRCVAVIAVIAVAMTFALAALAQESTPSSDGHDAHHGSATPATNVCAAHTGETPVAGDMMGSPMPNTAGMEFDLMFIDMMISHHEGAVAMARVAHTRAEHQEIRDLAQAIIGAQQAEIDRMREWREAWYPGAPAMPMDQMTAMMQEMMGDMPGMAGTPEAGTDHMGDMGDSIGTPGADHSGDHHDTMGMEMMDPHAAARALCNAAGPFDQAFIQAMIPHHRSAIAMAEIALKQATRPEIKELAQAIIVAQRAEIAQMEEWLAAWYGSGATDASQQAAAGVRVAVTQGEMFIEADRTAFRVGEEYVFVVTNEGDAPHDFVVEPVGATHDHDTDHAAAPNALNVLPGETKELVWTFAEPGNYELACRLPAHYEAGMFLRVSVAS